MEHVRITSTSNPRVKEAVRIRERKDAGSRDAFVIEGRRIVEMALGAGAGVREAFFTDQFIAKKEGRDIVRLLAGSGAEIIEVAGHVLARLADTETPQGIVAVVSHFSSSLDKLPSNDNPLYVLVDGIQDPGNLGAIIRTSDAAGADAVILLPGTCDAFMPKTIRATAGSIFNIPVVPAEAEDILKRLRDGNIAIAVTAADADRSVFEAALSRPLAFVFGNEGRGVSGQIRESANLFLKIPLYGKAESLNVATSAAICLYEAVRQRKAKRIN